MKPRILLLLPTTTYKATAMMDAASRLGVDVVVATERRQSLEDDAPGYTLNVDLVRHDRSVRAIAERHRERPFRAVVGVDDETTLLAALVGRELGLVHNRPEAVRLANDKLAFRRLQHAEGLHAPDFRVLPVSDPPGRVACELHYPCVVKPLGLSASRGVLRADDPNGFREAFRRVASIVADADVRRRDFDRSHLIVEDFLPGKEFAVEALLEAGELRPLALFDKPDPLDGPTFEETIYVTPSRLPSDTCARLVDEVRAGCRALGLTEGPIHAELRLDGGRPWLVELAPRTIGGRCARVLRFGAGVSLEQLVLGRALGLEASLPPDPSAAGVMMIPIPARGTLRGVRGRDRARAVPGIEEVSITRPVGGRVVPLPEGDRYLGFIFARADTPEAVEQALRRAHRELAFDIG